MSRATEKQPEAIGHDRAWLGYFNDAKTIELSGIDVCQSP